MSARPWEKVTDAVLINMDEDDVWELEMAWTNFHVKLGCRKKPDSEEFTRHNPEKCRPADRRDPDIIDRWEKLIKACTDRGCRPDGATDWEHVPGCRFRHRIESKDDTRKEIGLTVLCAETNAIPDKPLRVLRAIAAAGLASETPSIDVMAARPWLHEQTGLKDGEVKAAVTYLIRNGYIAPIEPEEIALRFKRRFAVVGRSRGRPAQWYRLLPPPAAVGTPDPAYDRLDAVLAEVAS